MKKHRSRMDSETKRCIDRVADGLNAALGAALTEVCKAHRAAGRVVMNGEYRSVLRIRQGLVLCREKLALADMFSETLYRALYHNVTDKTMKNDKRERLEAYRLMKSELEILSGQMTILVETYTNIHTSLAEEVYGSGMESELNSEIMKGYEDAFRARLDELETEVNGYKEKAGTYRERIEQLERDGTGRS